MKRLNINLTTQKPDMKIISHRGNLNGRNPTLENNPKYINCALNHNFDVEIDVWYINGSYLLGHDNPEYEIDVGWLQNDKFWCHAKNLEAAEQMSKDNIHYFWHENDKMTLTSKAIPWCFPNVYISNGVTVMIDENKPKTSIYGVCTDYPTLFV